MSFDTIELNKSGLLRLEPKRQTDESLSTQVSPRAKQILKARQVLRALFTRTGWTNGFTVANSIIIMSNELVGIASTCSHSLLTAVGISSGLHSPQLSEIQHFRERDQLLRTTQYSNEFSLGDILPSIQSPRIVYLHDQVITPQDLLLPFIGLPLFPEDSIFTEELKQTALAKIEAHAGLISCANQEINRMLEQTTE